jgi:hypothetical protein
MHAEHAIGGFLKWNISRACLVMAVVLSLTNHDAIPSAICSCHHTLLRFARGNCRFGTTSKPVDPWYPDIRIRDIGSNDFGRPGRIVVLDDERQ